MSSPFNNSFAVFSSSNWFRYHSFISFSRSGGIITILALFVGNSNLSIASDAASPGDLPLVITTPRNDPSSSLARKDIQYKWYKWLAWLDREPNSSGCWPRGTSGLGIPLAASWLWRSNLIGVGG